MKKFMLGMLVGACISISVGVYATTSIHKYTEKEVLNKILDDVENTIKIEIVE